MLADRYNIPLSQDIPAGAYRLIAGMYHPATSQRLPAYQSNNEQWPDNAIVLTDVVISSN